MRVPPGTGGPGRKRDPLPFAEENSGESDSESEEDWKPWEQPADEDAQPSTESRQEWVVAVDRPMREATVPRL